MLETLVGVLLVSVILVIVMFGCSCVMRVKMTLAQIFLVALMGSLCLLIPSVSFIIALLVTYIMVCKFSSSPFFPDAFVYSVAVWIIFYGMMLILPILAVGAA